MQYFENVDLVVKCNINVEFIHVLVESISWILIRFKAILVIQHT
jgi:hypothetical protein